MLKQVMYMGMIPGKYMLNIKHKKVGGRIKNGGLKMSEKSRKKVMDVIEETGYVPSQHAKSLRTKETKIIGVILPKISTDTSSRTVNGMNCCRTGRWKKKS